MMMNAILAVALGLAPVNADGSVDMARANSAASQIGHYAQSTDARGTTHVRGRDAHGRPYELVVDRNGHVEASVGEHVVWFEVSEA